MIYIPDEKGISYKQAVVSRKANPNKNYCTYGTDGKPANDEHSARDRLASGKNVEVYSTPKFKINKGEKVYTIGSCFARNVEVLLKQHGFNLPVFSEEIDQDIYQSKPHFPHTALNKYNPHSMALEILRALGEFEPKDEGLLSFGENKWFDPQMSFTKLTNEKLVRETRNKLNNIINQIITSDVLVLTLGLTETWFDSETGIVFNNSISAVAPYLRNSLKLFNSRPQEIYELLYYALSQLKKVNNNLKVVITVSPVPLTQTFLSHDVISANTYSKSSLRVAAQMLYEDLDFVDYYPSYEMVINSPRSLSWQEDRIHVTSNVVNPVIKEFVERYCD
jgi:hypothetical protein